jgi:DNA polymerase V
LKLKTDSVAVLNFEGELVVKKIIKKKEKYFLLSTKNNSTKEIEINTNLNTELWGVVTYVIHKL